MVVNVEFVERLEVVRDVCWKIVVDDVQGGGDYPKGVSYSTLNALSRELSCGLMWIVVAEISSWR